MNNLPEPILDNIYKYKHQLEFKHVMDELSGNMDNLYFTTKLELIKYLVKNADEIDCVILYPNQRVTVKDHIKKLSKKVFSEFIFNFIIFIFIYITTHD